MATEYLKCTCVSQFQDERYGKGIRVCNRKTKKGEESMATCTVCGAKHSVYSAKKEA